MSTRTRNIRILAIVAAVLILASATYAFAAANTVPASKAGDGSNTISGYTASAVHYNLNANNPTIVDSVTFTLDSTPIAGSTIRISLVSSSNASNSNTWYTCLNKGTAVTCDNGSTLNVPVSAINTLEIVIAD
jgi:hypothetical protein